jgi:hypothetical protein
MWMKLSPLELVGPSHRLGWVVVISSELLAVLGLTLIVLFSIRRGEHVKKVNSKDVDQ